ncbi:putative metalloprotease with PDZ domain [Pontibacter ummariensis]|uniref:Predicted metalloprotease, contains C-terminal PDZ domain n=1 Tax=Pontibacter ummariensis TaxID=1610492 RepID=A0A239JMD6_9BACT|nr:M61 family metallopeptidase [Pontibacter ummariensis]PRY07889.1 putative metalloprotease with PDZ domain [Pontibacter ummariensis]SNT06939.1 Predicted metalloprotease, contains C-terminal PDZ domain [Pontibacter ummariensis]
MIKYNLSYSNPLTHFLHITITIPRNREQELYLQLPAWRPGRYELQHFAQKLRGVTATANGEKLPIRKVTKDRWLIETNGAETVAVNYDFYARQMDAGGSWLDETQLYVNPINCMMAVEGREHEPCTLQLQIPEDWQVASGLQEQEKHTLEAANFDELVDSPFIASDSLKQETFTVNDIPFHIWMQGDCQPDWERIKSDFEAFTKEQLHVFEDFPVAEYHYLNEILPYHFYHGVEHSHSTVITLGPGELLMAPSLYKEFIGVSSHELFHTWNIKKIRPKELMPYNFSQENYFKTGYVAEGVTTYYGDYMLARSGFFTAEQYFEELNTSLQRYFADYSRNNLSVADSSFDLWLDGYKPGIPDRKVSIYIKGMLTAMLLDLQLRKATENKASLDTVMRKLWERFGKKSIGYSEDDYLALVDEVGQTSFRTYFDNFINGTAPIEDALDEALRYVGCTLRKQESSLLYEHKYGFKVSSDETSKVIAIAPDSPASEVLSIDDELVALNGRKLENNLQQLLALEPDEVELVLFRDKQLHVVRLQKNDSSYYSRYFVEKRKDATQAEQENFKLWLKQEF